MARVQRRRLVWIVDDSRLDAQRAKTALESSYLVEVFYDGAAVLERLTSGEVPDAMVLDWLMPDVSGLDVIEFIRREARFIRLGILLLTAQQATEQIVQGLTAGANDYVSKPYVQEELRARVDALVRTSLLWERAERAEETVRRLLDSHPEGLLAVDRRGDILYSNDKAMRFLGTDDLCGRPLQDVLPSLVPPVRVGKSGPTPDLVIEGRILAPFLSESILDSDKILLVALRDVTEERKAIERRVDFYSMIAHDLRSPLHAIRLRCDLARQGILREPEQLEECFRKISEHTTTLVELVDRFLELGQLEENYKVGRQRVDLAALLRETVELLEPLARQKQIALSVRTPERAEVLGDRGRLSQVISNILANALKFTPSAGHVDAEVAITDDDNIELSVTDDGPGIAEEDVPHIFERYRRADRTRLAGGSGLGLTIVRQVVDAHEGTVGVSSKPGQGSRFWVRLPGTAA